MKKALILAAVAAIALSACSKNEILETINKVPEEAPIGFSNYTPNSLTKANDTYVSSTTLVTGKQFAVYAWQTNFGSFLTATPGTPSFMNPAVVTWNDDTTDGDGNTYSPTRFWPSGDNPQNLSFTAYYPYGEAGITAPTFGTGVGIYAFEAQNTPAAMVDFCVADVVNDQVYGRTNATSAGYKNTVKFTFKHQLTKVQFKFKKATGLGAMTVIELVDAKLNNIKTSGTLTATFAQAGTPAVNALGTTTTTWSAQAKAATPIVYDITLNQANPESGSEIVLTESASTVHNDDIFLMVPQNMETSEQNLTITWKVKIYDTADNANTNNGTGLLSETLNTKTLSLKDDLKASDSSEAGDAPAINWAKNNFITYTITVGPKPIWFTAQVTGWDTEQNGYLNVN